MGDEFKTRIQLEKELAELQKQVTKLQASEDKLEFTERMLEHKAKQQEQLLETARYLTESLELDDVLTRIATKARDILHADGSTLYFLEEDGKTLTPMVAIVERFAEEILSESIHVDDSYTGQAVSSGKAMIFNDIVADDSGHHIPGTPVEEDERIISAPFVIDGKVIGAMCLNRNGTPFFRSDLALAETFATYACTALKNARIFEDLQKEVAERKRLEEELRELYKKYEKLLEKIE